MGLDDGGVEPRDVREGDAPRQEGLDGDLVRGVERAGGVAAELERSPAEERAGEARGVGGLERELRERRDRIP
ncbi:MAG: hypothetical protein R3F34_17615 [Planctomycetota bacterium]